MKIWRYLDLTKFVSMLATGTIYFTCVSRFSDPYEGWLPVSYMDAMIEINRAVLNQMRQTQNLMIANRPAIDRARLESILTDAERKLSLATRLKDLNEKFGASCWHINEGESEAMWRLYGASGAGIAIESTKERLETALKDATPHKVFIDPVVYMDFDNDPVDKGRHKHLMGFIKRKAFEHERELRALVMLTEPGKGKGISCDLNHLITKIHIAPLAEPYYVDAVRYVIDHSDTKLCAPVAVSKLLNPPDY